MNTKLKAARLASQKSQAAVIRELVAHAASADRYVASPTSLKTHLSTLDSAMRHLFLPRYREPIAEVLADAAALAGWQALDVGAVDRAWRHHETARRAALECGNKTRATEARRLARRAGSVRQRRRINALLRHRAQTGF